MVEHPDIKAISFVGGNNAGEYIHENGAKVLILLRMEKEPKLTWQLKIIVLFVLILIKKKLLINW